MNDDEQHWTSWQRNHRIPGEHRSAVFDDDPEERSGPVVWGMAFLFLVFLVFVATLIVLGVMHLAEKFVT